MNSFYAAGYQDALTKLAATRWEQVFRESPELFDDAIRMYHARGPESYRQGGDLMGMKQFMDAKDYMNAKAQALNMPKSNEGQYLKALAKGPKPFEYMHLTNRRAARMNGKERTQADISRIYKQNKEQGAFEPGVMDRLKNTKYHADRGYMSESGKWIEPPATGLSGGEQTIRHIIDSKLGPAPNFPADIAPKESNSKRGLLSRLFGR